MTMMEKLFVQIFERKNRIIEQVKQQTELYNQNLASKLLIEGITPPSWLWNPIGSSDSKELNKEELISKLLHPYTQASLCRSTAQFPLFDKPFVAGAYQEFSDAVLIETHDECLSGQSGPIVSATRGDTHAGCSLNCVPELDISIASPQAQTTERLLDIYNSSDQSLARIQRSKSRQKALELRNSTNALAEHPLGHETISGVLSGKIRLSVSPSKQSGHEDELPELAEPCAFGNSCHEALYLDEAGWQNKENDLELYSSRITGSGGHCTITGAGSASLKLSRSQNDRTKAAIHGSKAKKRKSACTSSPEVAYSDNMMPQSAGLLAVFGQNNEDLDSLNKEKEVVYSGKLSMFESTHGHQRFAPDTWKGVNSSNDSQKLYSTIMDIGDLQEDHTGGSPVEKNTFDVIHVDKEDRMSILGCGKRFTETRNISEPVHCSKICSCLGTLSRSSTREKPAANDEDQNGSGCQTRPPCSETQYMLDELRNGDFTNNEPVANSPISHSVRSGSNEQIRVSLRSSGGKQCKELESSVARDSVDSFASAEAKKLNFNVIKDQNLKIIISSLGNERPIQSPNNTSDLDLLRHKEIPNSGYDLSLGVQSPTNSEVLEKVEKFSSNSFKCNIQEHFDTSCQKYVSVTSEITELERPEDNIEGAHHEISEVEHEADITLLKTGGTSTLELYSVKPCWKQGHKSLAEQAVDEGKCSGGGSAKTSEASLATGSKSIRQSSFFKLVDNPGEESRDFLIEQAEMENPSRVALDKIEQFPVQESKILSCTNGKISSQHADTPLEENYLITNCKGTKCSEDLLLESRLGLVGVDSWPQLKRRKTENQLIDRSTTYPWSSEHAGSIQRDSPSRYLRNVVDVNTVLMDSFNRKMSMDTKMDQDEDADYINPENLTRTSGMLQEKSPLLEDRNDSQGLVLSPESEDLDFVDESMPVFEGFNLHTEADSGDQDFAANGIDLAKLNLSRIAIERASIIEEMCRSASLDTPMSHISPAFNFLGTANPFQSLSNHLCEHLGLKTSLPSNIDVNKKLDSGKSLVDDVGGAFESFERMSYSLSLPYAGTRYDWNSRIQPSSPVGRFWERLSSHSGSSEKCSTSNPELTCFPIEEDPCISEDNNRVNEIAGDVEEETDSSLASNCNVRHPLKDLTNIGLNPVSTFAPQGILEKESVDVVSTKSNASGTQEKVQWSTKYQRRNYSEMRVNQRSSSGNDEVKNNQTLSIGVEETKKAKGSITESVNKQSFSRKTSMKRLEHNILPKDSKRNNIVSNISSFIPLVQQKQAAAVCAGKRDVKVKALEAAEAAKRLEEKKENERKNRKEAFKLERAKLEVKNLRKMEVEKKRKELERKKKDVDVIAKKRLREEEERKEKERKRIRLEARQHQKELEERVRAERAEKEKQHTKLDEKMSSKKSYNELKNEQNQGAVRAVGCASKKEEFCTSGDSFEAEKALPTVDRSPVKKDLIVQKTQEKSYEISPYQCSDDEDEEDEELPTKKYIPSWASKSSVALLLPLQQKMEPDLIFHPESFCSMDEVLLPQKLQQKLMDA